MSAAPLQGLRVVDFSRVLAGPHCTKALRDLGADVTKIEPPAGDLGRVGLPYVNGIGLYYVQQNAGKRNLSLDLNYAEARGGIASADARQVEINDMIWKAKDRQRGAEAFFATGPATAVFQGD